MYLQNVVNKNYPANETPISDPIPYVTAAAAKPNATCLKPEYKILFPVSNVMAAPIPNNPMMLLPILNKMAFFPSKIINGYKGMIAPIENNR